MTALVTDNLPLLAASPNGIQQLRRLILELAFRGKLTQLTEDSISVVESTRNVVPRESTPVAEGGRPAYTEGVEADGPFALPRGWRWVHFGSVAQHNSGKTLDKGRNTGQPRDYITTSNLYWGRFELSNVRQMLIREDELERCLARKGDLLICEGGEAGRAAVWEFDSEICFQNHIHRARFFDCVNPYFAFRFFERMNATGEINAFRKGVGISNMSSKSLASIPLPLPPIADQHRIVAKINELMALCDRLEAEQADAEAAHATLVEALLASLTQARDAADFRASWQQLAEHFHTLFTTEASVDVLKQAVLRLGVMGKLVSQVEAEGDSRSILQQVQAIQSAKARRRTRAASSIKVTQPPFTIPKQWAWCELQDVFDVRDGTHDTPKYQSEGVPLVTSKNLSSGRLDLQDVKLISFDDHRKISERSKVDSGDVLFAMIGSIGNPVLVDTAREFSIKNVALFKPYGKDLPSSEYLLIYLTSVASDMRERSAGGVQSFVSLGSLRSYPFALPPVQEQERIVAKVNELISLCEQLKLSLAKARQHHEHLASILVGQAVA